MLVRRLSDRCGPFTLSASRDRCEGGRKIDRSGKNSNKGGSRLCTVCVSCVETFFSSSDIAGDDAEREERKKRKCDRRG